MDYIIKGVEVCRSFNSSTQIVHALKNINVNIAKGSLTILRGRSGSGKTTLINILGAIDSPSSGRVFFNDSEITAMSDFQKDGLRRHKFGFVFQSTALISNMTAFENIEFALNLAGFPSKDRKKRVEECLKLVGLSNRSGHFPYQLSGGEAQRIAIARAISHNPYVIFADEPTAALDTNMGLQVVNTFKKLVEREKLTVVMTTHDPNMMEIADFVYTLQDGEIVNE